MLRLSMAVRVLQLQIYEQGNGRHETEPSDEKGARIPVVRSMVVPSAVITVKAAKSMPVLSLGTRRVRCVGGMDLYDCTSQGGIAKGELRRNVHPYKEGTMRNRDLLPIR